MARFVIPSMLLCGAAVSCLFLATPSDSAQNASERVRAEASVREFGATGDGQADDTAAFQAAVESGIGSLRIPAGRYVLTEPVVIDLSRSGPVSLSGDGTAKVIREIDGVRHEPIERVTIDGDVDTPAEVRVRGVWTSGARAPTRREADPDFSPPGQATPWHAAAARAAAARRGGAGGGSGARGMHR